MKGGKKKMSKYSWKKGDKLKVIGDNVNAYLIPGTIVVASRDLETDNGEQTYAWFFRPNGSEDNYTTQNFEKVNIPEEPGKPKELHVILKDGCDNFVGTYNNYEDAAKYKVNKFDEPHTIYKLVPIAKIETKSVITPKKK